MFSAHRLEADHRIVGEPTPEAIYREQYARAQKARKRRAKRGPASDADMLRAQALVSAGMHSRAA